MNYGWIVAFLFLFSFNEIKANGAANGDVGVILTANGGTKTLYKVYNNWSFGTCNSYNTNTAESFSGKNFGNVNSLVLNGMAITGWTDNSDFVSGRIEYKIWLNGQSEPSSITGSFDVGGYGVNCTGASNVMCSSGNNRFVAIDNQSIDLLASLSPGTYNIKIWSFGQVRYNCGSFNQVNNAPVTAAFTKNPVVIFDGNGASSGSMSNQYVTYNTASSLNANAYTRTGYTFSNWNTASDASGTTYANLANVTLTNNLTLYAQWYINPIISLGAISGSPFCSGSSISVPYTVSGTFNSGNQFTAQLSNASGSFASPISTASVTSTTSGTISLSIPSNAAYSTAYKVRVISSNPSLISNESAAFTIRPIQFFANLETQNQTICSGNNITNGNVTGRLYIPGISDSAGQGSGVTVEFGYSSSNTNPNTWTNWVNAAYKEDSGNDDRYTINNFGSSLSAGTYYYTFRYRVGTCEWVYGGYNAGNWNGTTNTNGVLTVNSPPAISIQPSSSAQSICKDSPAVALSVTASGSGISYQWYSNTTNSNTGGTNLGAANGAQTATFTPPTSTVGTLYYYVVVSNASCASVSSSVSGAIAVTTPGVWGGSTNSDWNTASNWCGGVPTNTTDVVIPSTAPNMPTLSSNAVAKSITINNGATLNGGSGNLTLSGNFTNNGIYNAQTGTITVSSTGTSFVGTSSPYSFYNLVLNGGATFSAPPTILNILNIKAGGFVAGSTPIYASGSTLKYNSGGNYTVNLEWPTSTIPHHLTIGDEVNSSELNFGSSNTFRQVNGNVSIGADPLTARLVLSTASGGDLKVKGNYTVGQNSSILNNGRAVFFNGSSGNQLVTKTGGGNLFFDYLIIDKSAGDLQLSGAVGQKTNVQINSNITSSSYHLQLLNGNLDLNDQSFTMNSIAPSAAAAERSTNIQVGFAGSTGVRRIYTSTGSGDFIFTGQYSPGKTNALFYFPSSSTLTFDANVTLQTSVGLDFGTNGSTLINAIFQINQYGFVIGHSPDYGNSSFLIYNNGSNGFYRNMEWVSTSGAGYPNHVIIKGNNSTLVELDGASPFGYPAPNDLGCSGNLTIEAGATLKLNNMPYDLFVAGNINMAGSLQLSSVNNADVYLNGNWTQTGSGTLTPNNRTVFFNKQSTITAQTIAGSTTFDHLTLNNAAGLNCIGTTDNNTINKNLTLSQGKITLNTNHLTIGASGDILGYNNTKYIVTNDTGELKRTLGTAKTYPVGSSSAYNPITITNSGTSDVFGIRTIYGDITDAINAADPYDFFNNTGVLKLKWQITEANSGGSILSPVPQWNLSDEGANFSSCSATVNLYNGDYTWLEAEATYSSTYPKTATPISGYTLAPLDLATGNHYITVGDVHDTTTYFGNTTTGYWNKCLPNLKIKAILAGNFDTSVSTGNSFEAKKLTVNPFASLLIKSTNHVKVLNEVINNGEMTVENEANLLQINNTTNSGSITVRRNALMKRLDYTYWGSPVTGQNLRTFSPGTHPSRYYTYNESTDGFTYIDPYSNSFSAGIGYAIRAYNTYDANTKSPFLGSFYGVPNNGTVSVNLLYSG
ncbi:beta strand repeat-containing protein, partial [Cloacibacterium rupense]